MAYIHSAHNPGMGYWLFLLISIAGHFVTLILGVRAPLSNVVANLIILLYFMSIVVIAVGIGLIKTEHMSPIAGSLMGVLAVAASVNALYIFF